MPLPSLNFTDTDILTVVRSFFLSFLQPPIEVIVGQDNRVPEPQTPDFVVMFPMFQKRLEYNTDFLVDCSFIASINSSKVLTVTQILLGTIEVGNNLLGVGVGSGAYVSGSLSGTGGVGTYQLSGTIGAMPSAKFATGVFVAMQPIELTIQIDVHGPNSYSNAFMITTLLRDQYGVDQFAKFNGTPANWGLVPIGGTLPVGFTAMAPLYAEDPRQVPFINAEQQYETRWVIDARIQANQVVTLPQQFADTISVTLKAAPGTAAVLLESEQGFVLTTDSGASLTP